jgi:hypothetical protein
MVIVTQTDRSRVRAVDIEDLRRLARRRLPRVVFDYIDGGAEREITVRENSRGARAVLIGRAYAYGLGAAGGPGVACAIEILRTDAIRTLKLLGCGSVAELNHSYVGRFRDFCGSRAHRQAASRRVVAYSPHPLPRKHEDHEEDI